MQTEIEDFKQDDSPTPEPGRTSTCGHCGKEYPYRKSKKYCSNTCRSEASLTRKYAGSGSTTITSKSDDDNMPAMSMSGLNAQSAYIITHLQGENKRWQAEANRMRDDRDRLAREKEDLKEKIRTMEVDQKIKDIETAKPSGLSGLMENPMMQQLMPHIGPVLGEVARRVLIPGGGAAPGQLEGSANEIFAWIGSLPEQTQKGVYDLLATLSAQDPQNIDNIIQRIINLLTNGTGVQQHNTGSSATGTY